MVTRKRLIKNRVSVVLFTLASILSPQCAEAQTQALSFRPSHARYSAALDRIIMISADPDLLYIYNPAANADVTVALPGTGLSLAVSPDGLHAAVRQSANISYINLQTAAVEQNFTVTAGTGNVTLGPAYVYVFPSGWGDGLTSIKLSDGTASKLNFSSGFRGQYDAGTNRLYAIGVNEEPGSLDSYDISNGAAASQQQSPDFAQHAICGNLWYSPDGTRIYDGCGTVFWSSADSSQDMRYYTSFHDVTQITSLATSAALNQVALVPQTPSYVLPGTTPVTDGEIHLYDTYLNLTGRFVLPSFVNGGVLYAAHGHWLFYSKDSSKLYAVMEADSTSGLLNDFAVQTIALSNAAVCSVSLTSASDVAAGGSLGSVNVTAGNNCSYTATSNNTWISLVSGYYGSGNNTLTYIVRPNSGSARTGSITVGSETLTITQDGASSSATALNPLSFNVVAADYSKSLDRLVLLSAQPNELHIYNAANQADQIVPLASVPFSLSVSPDGQHAAVGQDGWISYVNLGTAQVEQLFKETTDVHEITLGGNGYIYAFPQQTWSDIYSLQISNGTSTGVSSIADGRDPRLHPSGKYLYLGTSSKWDIESGPLTALSQNFGGVDCGNIWMSGDGSRIFTACGTVYRSSTDPTLDLTANGTLAETGNVQWISDSQAQHKTVVIPQGAPGAGSQLGAVDDTQLQVYNYDTLTLTAQTTLPSFSVNGASYAGHGRFTFWSGDDSKVVTVEQADSSAGLTSGFGVTVLSQPGTLPPCQYSVATEPWAVGPEVGLFSVQVSSATCGWTSVSDVNWLHPAISGQMGGGGAVQVSVDPNGDNSARTGILSVAGQMITVTQDGAGCNYTISPIGSGSFTQAGGSRGLVVSVGGSCQWTATSGSAWLTITSGSSGSGNGLVSFTAAPNTTGSQRNAYIYVAGEEAIIEQTSDSAPVTPALRFVPVTPCRVFDSRDAGSNGPINGGQATYISIMQGPCGIPSTAQAYSLNATVVPQGFLGYLTIWPGDQQQPVVSTLNSHDGRVKANALIVGGPSIEVFATNTTHFVLDINGYFVPASDPTGLAFYPLTPCRVLDTRAGSPVTGTQTIAVQASPCNVPSTAQAYSLNFTAIPHQTLHYISVWPTGQPQPLVSTLNANNGHITANAAIVPAGTSGDISVFATQTADLVVDINGYFAPPNTGGLSYYSMTPCRAFDTRWGSGPFQGEIAKNLPNSFCAPPAASAYVMNATVVAPGEHGFLSLWPDGLAQPEVSTLNWFGADLISNMAIVPAGNGSIDIYAASSTDFFMDLSGYFAP